MILRSHASFRQVDTIVIDGHGVRSVTIYKQEEINRWVLLQV